MQHLYPFLEAALFTALLSSLLSACLRPTMILGWWLNWLADWWLLKNDPQTMEDGNAMRTMTPVECEQMTGYDSEYEFKRAKVRWFFFKPLGYCITCYNPWITLMWCLFLGFGLYGIIFTVLLSNFIVRYFYEKLL